MFVKIVHPLAHNENLFECDHVMYNEFINDNSRGTLYLHKDKQIVSEWEIDKTCVEIYFMNSDGKTIDSWKWPKNRSSE